ncbi:MAG: radical SAM protein [Thermoplasmata archaeon]|nr:radical SAM protein [Thermoplasmata archaeon]
MSSGIRISRLETFRRLGYPISPPREVVIAITYLCNARCEMCGIWKRYEGNPEGVREEMTLEEFVSFLRKNRYLENVTLTGGEIYLKKGISDFMSAMIEEGRNVGGATNALLPNKIKKIAKSMVERMESSQAFDLQISLDGTKEIHDSLRGIPGSFQKGMELLHWGLEEEECCQNIRTSVSHTITKSNTDFLSAFIDFLVNEGVPPERINFRTAHVSENYYGDVDAGEVPLSKDVVISEIEKVMKNHPTFSRNLFTKGIFRYLENTRHQVIPCFAAFTFCFVDPYWDVYPCISWSRKLGNLRDYDFDLNRFWHENQEIKKARIDVSHDRCPNCWTECMAQPTMNSNGLRARIILGD